MKYLSICSGIEAATVAFDPLGWEPVAFSEIEPFPSGVLAHHYPNVPNLGDMTKFKDWDIEPVDLIIAGTPCQSFSIAGLRKGLEDPRGNLMLTFLAIVDKFKPQWVVWENVPGVLSSSDKAFTCLLDGLEELGYIVDCDILDAQFHGLAQRRKRVFVCAQHISYVVNEISDASALTIAQAWQEILHAALVETSRCTGQKPQKLNLSYLSREGVERRTKLFGVLEDEAQYESLKENLIQLYLRNQDKHEFEGEFSITQETLRTCLDSSREVIRTFLDLPNEASALDPKQVSICARSVLLLSKLIEHSNSDCPSFWSAAFASFIAIKEYANHAGQTNNEVSEQLDGVFSWGDFLKQAKRTGDALGSIGVRSFEQIQPVSKSLLGDTSPGRKTWEELARSSTESSGSNIKEVEASRLVAFGLYVADETASTMKMRDYKDATDLIATAYPIHDQATRFSGKRGDKQDGKGNGLGIGDTTDPCFTLTKGDRHAVAHATYLGNAEGGARELPFLTCHNLGGTAGISNQTPLIEQNMFVRRLTPNEAEILQGFPPGYTDIKLKGKPTPDGPRYKCLGNSFAVPVVRWIGSRISEVSTDKIKTGVA